MIKRLLVLLLLFTPTAFAAEPTTGTGSSIKEAAASCDFTVSQWCKLETTNSFSDVKWTDTIEGQPEGCCPNAVGVFRDFNGMAYEGDSLYFHGGGHGGYSGNEVYELNLSTLRWLRLNDPAPLTDITTFRPECPVPQKEDGPYSGHTYGTPLVHNGKLHIWSSYSKCDGGETIGTPQHGVFDLAANDWAPVEYGDKKISSTVDLGNGNALLFEKASSPKVRLYDLNTGEVLSKHAGGDEWSRWGAAAMGGGLIAQREKDTLHLYDADSLSHLKTVTMPSGAGYNGGLDYHEGQWWLWNGNNDVHAINADGSGEWKTYEGQGPDTAHHVFSKWRYISEADAFFGTSKTGHPLWLFRPGTPLADEGGTTDPVECTVDACVGNGSEFDSVQNAVDSVAAGSTVALQDGRYSQCVSINKPITLTSISGRAHLQDTICEGKGVIYAGHTEGTVNLEQLEVSGGADVKGIWQHNDTGTLIVRDMKVHDSGMGIFAGPGAQSLQVYDSEIYSIDDPDERSHFLYGAEAQELIVENTTFRGGTDGHLIKAQSIDVTLRGNTVIQEQPTGINLIDVWGCGTNVVTGNDIQQSEDHIHGVGFTSRRGGQVTCPVDRNTATVTGNDYAKTGEQRWTAFVANLYSPMVAGDFTIENNVVDNAWLYTNGDTKTAVGDLNGTNTTTTAEPESIALTGGKYHVNVAGESVSTHYVSKEALEEATRQISSGATGVTITREVTTVEGDAVPVALTGGMYHLVVGGEVVSDHRQEKEALQQAVNAALAGKTDIQITRDAVRVEVK